MKSLKKILAVVLITASMLVTMTACNTTKNLLDQIQTDFNELSSEAASVATQLATALSTGADISAYQAQLLEVQNFISNFAMTSIEDLSEAGLNGVIADIQDMTNILSTISAGLGSSTTAVEGAVEAATSEDLNALTEEVNSMKSTLDQILSTLQSLGTVTTP